MKRLRTPFLSILVAYAIAVALFVSENCLAQDAGLQRLEVNNPDADAYLAVGLWSWIVPTDVDDDGNTDLIVSCEDVPYNGVWYFRNSGDDPVFPTFLFLLFRPT